MQKDFMNMAQGATATATPTATPGAEQVTEQDLQMKDEDFVQAGLTPGQGPEAMKSRIMELLQQMGAMENLAPAELQEITGLVDQLVKDMEAQNFEAVEQNPIMSLLGSVFEQMGMDEEAAAGGMAPADMAGMAGGGGGMPGGGMPGGGMPPMPGGGM
jgi:hypothetical protein